MYSNISCYFFCLCQAEIIATYTQHSIFLLSIVLRRGNISSTIQQKNNNNVYHPQKNKPTLTQVGTEKRKIKQEVSCFYIGKQPRAREWVAHTKQAKRRVLRRQKNRYSLWMACQDTSALEISALMPSPIPRRKCWHGGAGVCCKGTIWQSSMQLESQCAFFISLAVTLARDECNAMLVGGRGRDLLLMIQSPRGCKAQRRRWSALSGKGKLFIAALLRPLSCEILSRNFHSRHSRFFLFLFCFLVPRFSHSQSATRRARREKTKRLFNGCRRWGLLEMEQL